MPTLSFAVFGHPIKHSVSPPIHRALGEQFGIALDYRLIGVVPEGFANAVRQFFADGGRGANVTLPHKAAAFALADERSEAASRAGTANVLTRLADGRLAAHNTDGAGMVRDMTERHGIALHGKNVLLLGAGGAACGVAWNLLDADVAMLTIANRSPAAAEALVEAIGAPAHAKFRSWQDLDRDAGDGASYDIIIHATSAGVLGTSLQLPLSLVGNDTVCYDLSYGAAAAGFLTWAQSAGARFSIDGLGMLLETAADSFALWHGQRPVTEPVYQQLRKEYPLPQ
jgi:shikimate dehydrogenase